MPDNTDRFVRLEARHAEALLGAAGVLRDDIVSGKSYGYDQDDHDENTASFEAAYDALRSAIDDAETMAPPVDEHDRREAFAYRPGGRKLSAFPYPGGKTTYCDEIISRLPEHRRYVEPFGGSAAVLLNKPTSYIEVYNDLDDDIVHFFEVLRDRREDLQEWLYRNPFSRSDRTHYRVGEDFDHDQFIDTLRDRDAKWIVSYGDLPPGLEDVAETVATYTAMYSMSYDEQRQERTEHLAMNFDPGDETRFSPAAQKTLAGGYRDA